MNDAIVDLIYRSCALLDEERFDEWISLCAPGFRYAITAYSEEIGARMEWMNHDREELRTLLAGIAEHERSIGRLSRHVGMVRVAGEAEAGAEAETEAGALRVESSVVIHHTDLHGESSLYAVGRYLDRVIPKGDGGAPLLAEREVALQTRRFPTGSHVPL